MKAIEVHGVTVFDRERPPICDHCTRMLDGSEREVWVAGTRMWLHRKCEDPYFIINCKPA
jgi:hypothetical protein